MPLQAALAQVGVAKQTAKGTAIANPEYAFGITDGSILTVDVQQEREARTSAYLASTGVNRTGVVAGFDFSCRAHAGSIGLLSFLTLGTDTFATSTHTLTAGTSVNYATIFGKQGSTVYALQDAKVDSLEFSWDGNAPLGVKASGMGTTVNYSTATFTPGTDDTYAVYMRPAGGTFSVDVDGASGTAAVSTITSGTVTLSRNLQEIMVSGTITPADVFEGALDVDVSFDVVIDDWNLWRTIVTGTSAGTTAAAAPTYGTFSCQFTDGTNTLTLAGSRVAFTADVPSADPAGGPLTLSLAGLSVMPLAGGTPFTATLVGGKGSAY